ncbi:uncharacterized protein LOC143434095 [Arvicanthis niloticus]|uniref:uncharacterized protein LOC143308491 n=1 Tax=Arvicanthis niloticus TaxID=61156 RepID=UPI00402B0EFA
MHTRARTAALLRLTGGKGQTKGERTERTQRATAAPRAMTDAAEPASPWPPPAPLARACSRPPPHPLRGTRRARGARGREVDSAGRAGDGRRPLLARPVGESRQDGLTNLPSNWQCIWSPTSPLLKYQ